MNPDATDLATPPADPARASAPADPGRESAPADPVRASAPAGPAHESDPADPGADGLAPVRFDTKISILLREDLEPWQQLNVCAFLAGAIAAANPAIIGEPYEDADGQPYLAMFRQPVLVLAGPREMLTLAHQRALTRGLPLSLFTSDLFSTGHDRMNRAAIRAVPTDQLDLVGLAVHGPKNPVDKIFKGAHMHP